MDWTDWLRALFALIATLALIAGLAYAARRLGMLRSRGEGRKRLAVAESMMIDPRRQLVIVRCDGREHLLLLSPGTDLLLATMDAGPEVNS